jgi:hypothetical protein
MTNVVSFTGGLVGEGFVIDPDQVLECAKGNKRVVILMIDHENQMHIASSHGNADAALMLCRALQKI